MKIKNVLESNYFVIFNLFVGFFFWMVGLQSIGIIFLSVIIACIFLFCDDIKNIFCILIFMPSFIDNFETNPNWICYGIAIAIGVLSSIYFVVKKTIINKKKVSKGKMFYGFLFSTLAFLLGGITKFNFKYFCIIIGFSFVSYYIYWLAINFTNDFKTNLCYTFIIGSLFLSFQICFVAFQSGDFVGCIINRKIINVASQNINVVSLYIFIGSIMCFLLGYKSQKDYLFFLLSILLCAVIIFTFSRIVIILTFISFFICLLYTIKDSHNKPKFLIISVFLVLFLGLIFLLSKNIFVNIINSVLDKVSTGLNGRKSLWEWCWNLFKNNPLFGYGFVSDQPVPGVHDYIYLISAHCTPLQWLTSTGIIGTLLMCVWYYLKYRILFNKNICFFFRLILIMIAIFGCVQAVSLNFFIHIVTILLLLTCETATEHITN